MRSVQSDSLVYYQNACNSRVGQRKWQGLDTLSGFSLYVAGTQLLEPAPAASEAEHQKKAERGMEPTLDPQTLWYGTQSSQSVS